MKSMQKGFTLIEAVVVIVITGIIASVVAVFITKPVEGYFASVQRADMTDTADTALRRIARDLRLALPNSVRVSGNTAMEFLSTSTGGRYRAAPGDLGIEDPLDFNAADTTFDIFGPPITFAATTGANQNQIVIFNLGISGGANAYDGNTTATHNRRSYSGVTGQVNNITINSASPLPFESPSHRFQIVDTPVSYICDTAAHTLTRYWGYPIQPNQPNATDLAGINSALLARDVVACNFTYQAGVTERNGLVSMQLSIRRNNETITLYHEVHVSNAP